MLTVKQKSNIQEKLTRLYLRMNGFLSEGFIAHHNDNGRNLSEIDLIAVRFPFHSEIEREVSICERLNIVDQKTHIFIGEVKSHGQPIQFNASIQNNEDVLRKVMCRLGIINNILLDEHLASIHALFQTQNGSNAILNRFEIPSTDYVVSAVIFKPETINQRENQNYFFTQHDIFSFLWACLRPEEIRCGCATNYDFSTWGEYEDVIHYFKNPDRREYGTMGDLYQFIDLLPE